MFRSRKNILKKLLCLAIIGALSYSMVACGNKNESKDENKINQEENIEQDDHKSSKAVVYKMKGMQCTDGGITQSIEEVGVFSNMNDASKVYKVCKDLVNEENKDKVTVVVKFEVENENDYKVSAYTSVRPFVANTGERGVIVEGETYDSEINPKESSEGYAIFNLSKTKVDELKSFDMWWIVAHTYGEADNEEIINKSYAKDNKFHIVLE